MERLAATTTWSDTERSLAEQLLQIVGAFKTPMPDEEILEALRGRRANKVVALRKVVAAGFLVRVGKGSKGDPFLYTLPTNVAVASQDRPSDDVRATSKPSNASQAHERIYTLPTGEKLSLTDDEFNEIIEVFRTLLNQQQSLEQQGLLGAIGYREVELRTEGEEESSNPE